MRVAEIFESVSGEVGGFVQGSPCTFIRLAGCNLRCPCCDTSWTQDLKAGEDMSIEEVVNQVDGLPWRQVLITGGEPLVQRNSLQELVEELKKYGYTVQVETNGTLRCNVALVDYWVIDRKWPDSIPGIDYSFDPGPLSDKCWVKHLVGSRPDLDRAVAMTRMAMRWKGPQFAISPLILNKYDPIEAISYEEVVNTILQSKLPITLNVQLHKLVGAR